MWGTASSREGVLLPRRRRRGEEGRRESLRTLLEGAQKRIRVFKSMNGRVWSASGEDGVGQIARYRMIFSSTSIRPFERLLDAACSLSADQAESAMSGGRKEEGVGRAAATTVPFVCELTQQSRTYIVHSGLPRHCPAIANSPPQSVIGAWQTLPAHSARRSPRVRGSCRGSSLVE